MTEGDDNSRNGLHANHANQSPPELPDEIFERLFSGDQQPVDDRDGASDSSGTAETSGQEAIPDGGRVNHQNGASASPQPATSEVPGQPANVSPQRPQEDAGADQSRGRSPGQRPSSGQGGVTAAVSTIMEKVKKAVNGGGRQPASIQPRGEHLTAEEPGDTQHAMTEEVATDLERRLKLSLRETALAGIGRVAVGSPKGGVGKSSLAYAVAGAISYYTNMRVCLVDADPNFGATRLLVPRPIEASIVELARDADELAGLADLRGYIAQNERMRLDVVLGPKHAYELAEFDDLGAAYERIDRVLSRHYDLIVYDLGLGFRDPAIRNVLDLCNELLFVTDSEVIPNALLSDGIAYVRNLGVDLARTTLVLNHRLPPEHESAGTDQVRRAHTQVLRRVTEVPYDASMSQLLNRRAFHIESLSQKTRLGILTTLAACLEGLRSSAESGVTVSSIRGAASKTNGRTPGNHDNRR